MVRFRCKTCPAGLALREKALSRLFGGDPLGRRVWGQRPGQPGGSPNFVGEGGGRMDLVLKGRGMRITDQIRRTAEHKLAKISRLDPRVQRIEAAVIEERNPRIDGTHKVDVAC